MPEILIQKIFSEIFSFINVQLFNRWIIISSCWRFSSLWMILLSLHSVFHLLQSASASWVLLFQQWRVRQVWFGRTWTMVCPSKTRGNKLNSLVSLVGEFCGFFCSVFSLFSKCFLSRWYLALQYAGSSWDELKHIRQAVGFLVSIILRPKISGSTYSLWLS